MAVLLGVGGDLCRHGRQRSTTARCSSPALHREPAWPDGAGDGRTRGAAGGAGDAVGAAPGPVLALDAGEPGADGLAPPAPLLPAGPGEGLGGEQVRDVLLSPVAAEAPDERLVCQMLPRRLGRSL